MGQYCEKGMNIDNENMMYKCADDLLYKAKAAGRNQVKCNPVFS
jgi:PleD family two-component response regulator